MLGSLINTILPVFLVMGLGYGIRRKGLVGERFFVDANRLVYYVCLPCLLFVKIVAVPLDRAVHPMLITGSVGVLVLTFGTSYIFARMAGYSQQVTGVFSQAASRGNIAYMGLAVIYYGIGDEGLARASLLLACLMIPVNLLSILVLAAARSSCDKRGLVFWCRECCHNPLILSVGAGLVVTWLGLSLPAVLNQGFELVSAMTLPLALVIMGGGFVLQPVRWSQEVVWSTVFKNLLMPFATLLVLNWLEVTGVDLAAGVLLAAMPTAMVSAVMASEWGGDTQVAGSAILVSTLTSLLTVSGWLYVVTMWCGV